MAMRLTGMMSGMDTESIIQELVSARRTKVDKQKKAQTKLSWKQDAWKELNTKLKNLQSKFVSNMRFSSSYSKKVTKVSNSSAVSVITGENAVDSVQSLQINRLAKTGYLTGAQLESTNSEGYTALTKLSELTDKSGNQLFSGNGTISVKTGNNVVDINVNEETTISDVLTQLKETGLNASFDAKTQRFFISSKESGLSNDFSITATDAGGDKALSALGLQTDLTSDKATAAQYVQYAEAYVAGNDTATLANLRQVVDDTIASRVNSYVTRYKSLASSKADAQKAIDELNEKYKNASLDSVENLATALDAKSQEVEAKKQQMEAETQVGADPDRMRSLEDEFVALNKELSELNEKKNDAVALKTQQDELAKCDAEMADIRTYVNIQETTEDGKTVYSAQPSDATGKLTGEVEQNYLSKAEYAVTALQNYQTDGSGKYVTDAEGNLMLKSGVQITTGATKVSGQDAEISLNGATFTGNTNVFEINGLTFTALSETQPGETITVTTQQDTDGIYDMVKNFLKEYNSIINEMDKLYNAESAKGYEPLTSEEKDAMSESEVKEWETKIKDALLRKDDNLSSVSSALKSVMSAGIEVNGKTMYLFNFGIDTLGYFEAADNEKNAYHIDGDEDDTYTSGNADKLKGMISSDPDTVISFFTQLSRNLYQKMSDLSSSVDGYRTYGSFYDDKKMKSDYDDYTNKIADLEKKLNDYEDKWYKKFSAMETAMAKMQSNMSAVTGLLGG
ncbi:MAG: flagellar filament capping protein FliD [Bacteroidales bacterium]|nr:flagellar filament capping protein FliD [Lachnoclostridium sp.]MCM1385203.1 flagellar filament capping protein FliD [Lachnoclostridium sp.]MCM1466112.1 flagellar filament capping protein FliD [Bacteroidales bacterium]